MTTRTFTNRLTRALRERALALVDVDRPEGTVFLTAVAGTEIAKATGFGPLEKLSKPFIVPGVLAIALRDGELDPVEKGLLSTTAAGYTVGDVILMLGGGHASRSRGRLVAGAGAFAVGHLALGTMMLRAGIRPKPLQMAVHGVIAGGAGGVLLTEDRENAPLAAYGTLLAALSALATSVEGRSGTGASVLTVGGPMFLLSDALILARRKTEGGSALARVLDVGVIETYALAALLLLTGTASASRDGRRL